MVNINKLLDLRTLTNSQLSCSKDKNGRFALEEYVIGVDVARSNAQSNNKSAIVVLKVIRNKQGVIRQIQLVNLIEPPNGLNFTEQSILVKKVFYQYGGKLDMNKSRVKAIVVDGNVIGKGLIDRLLEEVTDPETNEELGCFATINTDQKPQNGDAPKVVYDLTAQGINGDIIRIFMDYVESQRLKLLKPYDEIKTSLPKSIDKIIVQQACLHTQYLIDEVANLKLKKTTNSITVEQATKRIDKDRYSALAYALYYINLFLEKQEEDSYEDDDPLVYYI